MKIGIVISLVILLLIGGMLFLGSRGTVTGSTSLTAASKLKAQTLPALAPLYEPTKADENATAHYEDAVDIAYQYESSLTKSPRPAEQSQDIVDHLVAAMDAGRVQQGMLDQYVDVALFAEPKFGLGILIVQDTTLEWARNQYGEGKEQEAVRAVRALFAFGHRLFTHSVRMTNRLQGLQLMQSSLAMLSAWSESTAMSDLPPDAVSEWTEAVDDVYTAWTDKMKKLISTTKPPVGDLLNMAKNEQDLSLRIEAVLALAIVKHAPGSKANLRVIEEAIEQAKSDANPLIAKAGEFAAGYTVDDLRSQK
jgi:hypothetical protein